MTVDEFHECNEALRHDPRVAAALADRGITDLDLVLFDTWAYGAHLLPEAYDDRRLGWTDVWYRREPAASPYANPVTGLHFIVDLNRMELLEVEDEHRVDEPRTMGEYVPRLVPGLVPRDDLKPLAVRSPRARRSRSRATGCAGRSGRCGSASTTARGSSCTPWATRTAVASAPSRTASPSPRWSCPTATRRPSTTAAPPSTSASGASGS